MIGKVKLLANFDELQNFDREVEEKGIDELTMLGKYNKPAEKFISKDFMFKLNNVDLAWLIGNENDTINIRMNDGEMWSLYYDEKIWNKLKEYFEE